MAYTKTNWVNDQTELSAENFNHLEDGVEKAYGQLLLAVDSVAPEECSTGDKYYNTETNKIYTATGTNTWGTTGVDAELGVFYIVLESQNIYTYDGEKLISVGGGAGGGDSTPIGTVQEYAGSTAPDGYLMCDGSSVSRTTYKDLFRVIGTTYGSGDGSTTFNLPNIKGRVVVMLDSNDTDFDTLGETGGEKTHTLTVNEMPSHNHSGIVHTWDGTTNGNHPTGGGAFIFTATADNTGNTGGNQPHNIVQPYIVLNKIIKVQKTAGEVLSEQLPVGTEVDFDGTSADIPIGWEQVSGKSYVAYDLWTNDDITVEFGSQTISFNDNYSYYDIITIQDGLVLKTDRVYVNNSINYILQICQGGYIRTRDIRVYSNIISFDVGKFYQTYANATINNYQVIPYKIIGYKEV